MNKLTYKTAYALTAILLLVGSLLVPRQTLGAVETGGYPWADAQLIRAATYDWGYTSCQPPMQKAGTCPGHTTTKLGIRYYQSDPWHYDVRNCTSYVAWRINQEFSVAIPRWGNAKDWGTSARRAGYKVDNQPAVGSIAQWEGYYGHVAYVTAVNADGSVNVDQYNKAGTGMFSRQSRVRADHYIHIGTLPSGSAPAVVAAPATTPSSSEEAKVTPQPAEPAASIAGAQPVTAVPALAPLAPVGDTIFPDQQGVSYLPVLDPIHNEVNVFAIEYAQTNSHKLEISRTSTSDGNTAWRQHWVTSQPLAASGSLRFLVADANADGRLDVYIIGNHNQQDGSASTQKVTILDGAEEYSQTIGDWETDQSSSLAPVQDQQFSLADYDGNGSLDLYSLQSQADKVNIHILDGSRQFKTALAKWQAPIATLAPSSYTVGDHDRDGRADIYAIGPEVTVLSGSSNYQKPITTWKRQQSTSQSSDISS